MNNGNLPQRSGVATGGTNTVFSDPTIIAKPMCTMNVQRFDLELWNTYDDRQFLNNICYKLNECIDVVNITQEQFKQLVQWIDESLYSYTNELLLKWLNDGSLKINAYYNASTEDLSFVFNK